MGRIAQDRNVHFNENTIGVSYVNRSTAPTIDGAPYFVDTAQTDGDSTTVDLGLDGLVVATSALTLGNISPLVIAREVAADNARVLCTEPDVGGTRMRIRVESTTDILKGSKLAPHATLAYFVLQGTPASGWYAIALEGRTADSIGYIQALVFRFPRHI